MKKRIPTLLATMIGTALYSQQGLAADLASQCMLGVPSYNRPLVKGDTNDLPVTINADSAKGNYPDNATFTGNVDINQATVACLLTKCNCTRSNRKVLRRLSVRWMRWVMCTMTTIRSS